MRRKRKKRKKRKKKREREEIENSEQIINGKILYFVIFVAITLPDH